MNSSPLNVKLLISLTSILQSYYKGNRLGRYLGINGSAGSLGRALYPSLLILVSILLLSDISSAVFFGVVGTILDIFMKN